MTQQTGCGIKLIVSKGAKGIVLYGKESGQQKQRMINSMLSHVAALRGSVYKTKT